MRPNTPHAVYTIEDSIAVGGHFFSFSTIQQTFFALVHAFVMDTLVTNTEHPDTRILLFRMLQYLYKFYVDHADPKSKYDRYIRHAHILNHCKTNRECCTTPSTTGQHGHID